MLGDISSQQKSSIFDNPDTPQKTSNWIKDTSIIQEKEITASICKGKLYKKSKKGGSFQVKYTFYLLPGKLLARKNNKTNKMKYLELTRSRIQLVENMDEDSIFYGFKIKCDGQEVEFFAKSQAVIDKWYEYLSKYCIKIDFSNYYTINELLGKGNFAQVFLVKNIKTGEEFAAKAYDAIELNRQQKLKTSLLNEIFIMRKMDHPSIIKLYDVYETEQNVYLILELVKGGELFNRVVQKEKYNEEIASKLMKRLLSAIKHMHERNIIHRDLKLENILLTSKESDYEIKVADFGLSTTTDNIDLFRKCGTPGFVAPEVLLNYQYGTKVDIFSLGVILYVLLSGCTPFPGKSFNTILQKNIRCELQFKAQYWLGVSQTAIDLVKKMLQRDPEKRISYSEILKHEWIVHAEDKSYHMSHSFMADVENEEQKIIEKQTKIGQNFGNFLAAPQNNQMQKDVYNNSGLNNGNNFNYQLLLEEHSNNIGKQMDNTNPKNIRKFAIFQNIRKKVKILNEENKELEQNYNTQDDENYKLEIDSILKVNPQYANNYDQSLLFANQRAKEDTQQNNHPTKPKEKSKFKTDYKIIHHHSLSDEWNFDEYLMSDSPLLNVKMIAINEVSMKILSKNPSKQKFD